MTDRPELPYWLARRRAGLGSTNFALLLAHFGSIEKAWDAPLEEIARAGLDAQYMRAFTKARGTVGGDEELARRGKHGVRVVTWLDNDFPPMLREIPQSPPVLFLRGSTGADFEQAVAVVGTRKVTPCGRQACAPFCAVLARAGAGSSRGWRAQPCWWKRARGAERCTRPTGPSSRAGTCSPSRGACSRDSRGGRTS